MYPLGRTGNMNFPPTGGAEFAAVAEEAQISRLPNRWTKYFCNCDSAFTGILRRNAWKLADSMGDRIRGMMYEGSMFLPAVNRRFTSNGYIKSTSRPRSERTMLI